MSDDANKSSRVWVYVLAAVVLTACIMFPCGIGLGWFGKGGTPPPVDGKVQAKGGKNNGKKDGKKWNWQDIQDHLAAKGWKTQRHVMPTNMFFRSSEGEYGQFFANEFATAEEAKENAARRKDVEQIHIFAWDRFTFTDDAENMAKLKQLLP